MEADKKIMGVLVIAEQQQREMADTIAVMKETVDNFKCLSQQVSEQINTSVRQEIGRMDIGQLISVQTAKHFADIEENANKLKVQAEKINSDTYAVRQALFDDYSRLKNAFWWLLCGGVVTAILIAGGVTWYFSDAINQTKNAIGNTYWKVDDLQKEMHDKAQKK